MPNLHAVQRIFDCETIVSYVMYGNTNRLSYARLKCLLLNGSIGRSVDVVGMVYFKKYDQFPKARRSDLHVPEHVHLPYPFLSRNINNIIDFLSDDSHRVVNTEKIVEKIVLLAGSFSRIMCGLKIEQPRLAASAFSSSRIEELKDQSLPFQAVFETNMVSFTDVSSLLFHSYESYICRYLLVNVFFTFNAGMQHIFSTQITGLAVGLVPLHGVSTRFPSDWDEGHNSFVHVMHRFAFQYIDVFPMYFTTDNTQMRKVWYGVKKSHNACLCLKGITNVRTVTSSLPTNNMTHGYEEQFTVPVARSELIELRSMVHELQEQNKYFIEQMKRQQVCIIVIIIGSLQCTI